LHCLSAPAHACALACSAAALGRPRMPAPRLPCALGAHPGMISRTSLMRGGRAAIACPRRSHASCMPALEVAAPRTRGCLSRTEGSIEWRRRRAQVAKLLGLATGADWSLSHAFEHYLLHTGGRGILDELEKELGLAPDQARVPTLPSSLTRQRRCPSRAAPGSPVRSQPS